MADAAAAGAEFLRFPRDAATRDRVLRFDGYVGHPTHGHAAGKYTDDAEMSVGNALVLIEHGPTYTPLQFADAWMNEFERGGRRTGYARRFQAFLETNRDGPDLLDRIVSDSDKNGAAMRAPVIGVLPTVAEVLEVATLQAAITHNTLPGLFSARAAALMAHFALYEDAPLSRVGEYCLSHLSTEDVDHYGRVFRRPWNYGPVTGRNDSIAIATVHAAATLVMREPSLMDMLRTCVEWGGDTDSVAAVAWGIASPRFQDERLARWMTRDLEQGSRKTGAPRLHSLGTRLMAKYS